MEGTLRLPCLEGLFLFPCPYSQKKSVIWDAVLCSWFFPTISHCLGGLEEEEIRLCSSSKVGDNIEINLAKLYGAHWVLPWCCEGWKCVKHTLVFREPVVSLGRQGNHEVVADNKAVWCRELGWKTKVLLLFPGTNLARKTGISHFPLSEPPYSHL